MISLGAVQHTSKCGKELELIDMQQHAPGGSRGMLFISALRDEVWHGLLCGNVCVHDHASHRNTHTHTDTSHRYVPNSVGNSCPSQRAVRNAVLLLQHNESRPGPSSQQLERGVCWVCSTHAHVEHWVFPLSFRLQASLVRPVNAANYFQAVENIFGSSVTKMWCQVDPRNEA